MQLFNNYIGNISKKASGRICVLTTSALLAALGACGVDESFTTKKNNGTVSKELSVWSTRSLSERFSAKQIQDIYSNTTAVKDGKTYPVSKLAKKSLFTEQNAPQAFRQEHGAFTAGAEMKAYLNLGYVVSSSMQKRLVSNFEKISTWKSMIDENGKPVFKNAFATDNQGAKIADNSDGLAPSAGEIHYANLSIDTGTPAGAITIPSRVTIYQRDGITQVDVENRYDVKVVIIGTLIKAEQLRIHVEAFPYQNGWLIHGSAAVTLEQMKDAIKPEMLGGYVDGIFNWLRDNTILPLKSIAMH